MTSEEKAKKLVDKYKINRLFNTYGEDEAIREAKQCALIVVDEIIKEYSDNICNCGYDYDILMWDAQRDKWKEVKQEIEKL